MNKHGTVTFRSCDLAALLNEAHAELRCSCHPPGTVLDDCLGTCVQAKLAKTIEIIQPNSEGESQ